jgi:hypothetical protein
VQKDIKQNKKLTLEDEEKLWSEFWTKIEKV